MKKWILNKDYYFAGCRTRQSQEWGPVAVIND